MLGLADGVPLLPQNTGLQFGLEGDSLAMVKLWGCSYDSMVICAEYRTRPWPAGIRMHHRGRVLVDVSGDSNQSKTLWCPVATSNSTCLSFLI